MRTSIRKERAGDRELVIALPPSYEVNETNRYPAIYVQDGGIAFTNCANYLEHRWKLHSLPEAILVGIMPVDRNAEYTPWPAPAPHDSAYAFEGRGREYVEEVADAIKPWVDRTYRTDPGPEQTAIVGGSLGGLISLFAAYWRPETFGRVGLLSASFWYPNVMTFLRSGERFDRNLKVYMSVGECEGLYKTNEQRFMLPYTLEARTRLLESGVADESLRLDREPGGTHDALFMTKHFPRAIEWLFGGSAASERTYRIFVAIPSERPPESGYPVLYALDGNACFGTFAEAMRLQTRPPHGYEPTLIVAIGYDAEGPIVSEERFLDYTIFADASELPARPNGSPWPPVGGADAFLGFIEDELKPRIERDFRVDRAKQALFGHSLGGFFALYALLTKPSSFRSYVAGSPSVWWKGGDLLRRATETAGLLDAGAPEKRLLIGLGSEEKPSMLNDAEKLVRILTAQPNRNLRVHYRVFEEEGHISVLPPLISRTLRFISQ
ncbi:alpha/beta hydrolase-fold protein [Paenibacillus sp. TRM 82003]|nr:alpha/beta hydrolase-fold protein [Paenibacillus sp. TRM 82003]